MQSDAWLSFFTGEVQRTGLSLSEKQNALFLRYMHELIEWNRSTNLTRIIEPRSIATKHFLDSILITRHISIADKNIVDVGSGGGFPGIPLAILEPGCRLVLIESVRKKTSFLKHIARTLQLKNVQVYNGRAEGYPESGTFDLAVSRAFSSLAEFADIALRLIKPRGSIICMKGPKAEQELAAWQDKHRATNISYVEKNVCPAELIGKDRQLLFLRKKEGRGA